ncbi:MAG: YigZ family protein [Acidobacteria bacterium]|nr:YigZ family protein [Acidobacteriota bacterium]
MRDPKRYRVPAATHRVEQEISRSRFITTASRVSTAEEAAAFVRSIAEEFSDATHNCWAYLVGPPGDTGRVGMSDDGEPHGTAGRPMLSALLHSGVGDIAVVVTRYYGGTKLGTGGLVRAYGGGVQQVLATLPVTERIEYVTMRVSTDYARITALQQLFPSFEAEIVGQTFEAEVTFDLRLPLSGFDALRQAILDATRGQASIA